MTKRRRLLFERLEARIVFSFEPLTDQPSSETATIEPLVECQSVEVADIQDSETVSNTLAADSDAATLAVPLPNVGVTPPSTAEVPYEPPVDASAPVQATLNPIAVGDLFAAQLPPTGTDDTEASPPNNELASFRLTNITPDEQRAIDLCGDDPECREQVENLIQILRDRDAPPWFSMEPITYGGRCVWWSTHCHSDFLDAQREGVPLDTISMTEEMKYYIGPNPLWSEHHYVQLTLPNGSVFYADVYWLGGSDHIFFELPWSLVDAEAYAEFMERCTAAMDATMH